jgi:twitching motility protein PilT
VPIPTVKTRTPRSAAIRAAETGHLVFGTLHTPSAAKTVDRIIDVFPSDQRLKADQRAFVAEMPTMSPKRCRGQGSMAAVPPACGRH